MEFYKAEEYRSRALITFSYDDGRRNNYDVALPLHEQFSIPASFAIIANRAVDPKHWGRYMAPHQIVDASQRGAEITSHGMMHEKKFTELNDDSLDFELLESKRLLEGMVHMGQEVNTLCLPFSASNDHVLSAAFKEYVMVRGLGRELNDPFSASGFVSSFPLLRTTAFTEIKAKIDLAVKQQKWIVLMLHGVVDSQQPTGLYDISKLMLLQILQYVHELGPQAIRPTTFNEVIELRKAGPPSKRFYQPEISRSGSYTLAEAPGYLITFHKSKTPTNKLVVSFGGLPSKKTPTGFGSQFILKQGYDHIFVAQSAYSQYQKLSLPDFVKAIEPYLADRDVFTYGSSLGAYAALYYGGAINASIIASAPKNSAHPTMRKKRFDHVEFTHRELTDVRRSDHQPLILFDPLRTEETQFIENWVLPAYPDAYLVKAPFAGHLVLQTMQEAGILKEFITTYIDQREIIPFELQREGSYTWHREKGHWLRSKSLFNDAKLQYQKSLEIRQTGEAVAGLARILLRESHAAAAYTLIQDYRLKTGSYKDVPLSLRKSIEQQM